jgi:hypothetical protein
LSVLLVSDRSSLPPGLLAGSASGTSRRPRNDCLRRGLDLGGNLAQTDHYRQQALEVVLSGKADKAFRVDLEPDRVREAYGRHSLGERVLLARRLVEAGVTFVTVSSTYGVFDNHGDDHFAGGLVKGLKPLLARVDQVVHATACWTPGRDSPQARISRNSL